MKRIVLHWTGGGPRPNPLDLRSYHFLVAQDGERHEGNSPPEANRSPLRNGYVRHAGGFNSDAIGIGLCGMLEARESPFSPGPYPITAKQFEEACEWAAELCVIYKIPVKPDTVLLHSEVRPRFGAGVGKWDVNWLPGMARPGNALEMGDAFRARVQAHVKALTAPAAPTPAPAKASPWAGLLAALAGMFRGRA